MTINSIFTSQYHISYLLTNETSQYKNNIIEYSLVIVKSKHTHYRPERSLSIFVEIHSILENICICGSVS